MINFGSNLCHLFLKYVNLNGEASKNYMLILITFSEQILSIISSETDSDHDTYVTYNLIFSKYFSIFNFKHMKLFHVECLRMFMT
jgi:hypothetical protein